MRNNYQRDNNRGGEFGKDRKKEFFKATCADCGKICEIPFRPSGERPVYCRDCFGNKGGRSPETFPKKEWQNDRSQENKSNRDIAEMKIQVAELGRKIDRLTQTIEAFAKPKPIEVKEKKEAKVDLAETVKKAIAKEPTKKGEKVLKKKASVEKRKK